MKTRSNWLFACDFGKMGKKLRQFIGKKLHGETFLHFFGDERGGNGGMGKMQIKNCLFLLQDRLRPGRMLLVDLEAKVIEEDEHLKMQIALSRNHKKLTINRLYLDQIRKDDVVCFFNWNNIKLIHFPLAQSRSSHE